MLSGAEVSAITPPSRKLTGVNPRMNEGAGPYKAGVFPRISALIDLSSF